MDIITLNGYMFTYMTFRYKKKISPNTYEKISYVPSTSVCADQALEQTVNRDAESIAGTSHLINKASITAS